MKEQSAQMYKYRGYTYYLVGRILSVYSTGLVPVLPDKEVPANYCPHNYATKWIDAYKEEVYR